MKVLFITRHYLDQTNGGAMGARAYLDAFSSLYNDLTLLYPSHDGLDITKYVQSHVKCITSKDKRTKIKKGLDVYKGRLHRFLKDIKEIIYEDYDIIVLDHSILASEMIDLFKEHHFKAKIITIHCNVEILYNRDNPVSILYRIPYNYYIKKAEEQALNFSFLNLTVTKDDAEYFRDNICPQINNIEYWGTFEYKNSPKVLLEDANNKNTFVISGSLNYKQTVDAISEFVLKYYPILKRMIPGCDLIITGRNPSMKIIKLCENDKTIKLYPNPYSIIRVINMGRIYVCPIFGGSGVKLRIMDGLKLGMPVICHQNSSKGYEDILKAGGMYLYHDENTFKKSIQQILVADIAKEKIVATYYKSFGFEAGKNRLYNILQKYKLL